NCQRAGFFHEDPAVLSITAESTSAASTSAAAAVAATTAAPVLGKRKRKKDVTAPPRALPHGRDPATPAPPASPSATAAPEDSALHNPPTPVKVGRTSRASKAEQKQKSKEKGPIDLDRQCGVLGDNGVACARSITCKIHPVSAKRAVVGRSAHYDLLYQEYQSKNRQESAMKAGAAASAYGSRGGAASYALAGVGPGATLSSLYGAGLLGPPQLQADGAAASGISGFFAGGLGLAHDQQHQQNNDPQNGPVLALHHHGHHHQRPHPGHDSLALHPHPHPHYLQHLHGGGSAAGGLEGGFGFGGVGVGGGAALLLPPPPTTAEEEADALLAIVRRHRPRPLSSRGLSPMPVDVLLRVLHARSLGSLFLRRRE
ncbi:hypothetical protein HK405_015636, partial [Cladochytrium tenue]